MLDSPQKDLPSSDHYEIDYEKIKNLTEAIKRQKEAEPNQITQNNPHINISEILQGKDKILGSDFEEIQAKQVKEEISAFLG